MFPDPTPCSFNPMKIEKKIVTKLRVDNKWPIPENTKRKNTIRCQHESPLHRLVDHSSKPRV